jgi:hypothetical protein
MTAVTGQPGSRGQTAIAAMPQISDETGITDMETLQSGDSQQKKTAMASQIVHDSLDKANKTNQLLYSTTTVRRHYSHDMAAQEGNRKPLPRQ